MRQSVCHVVAQTMLISHNRTPCLLASSARQHTPLSGGKANFVRHSTAHTAAAAALHAEAAAVTAWRQALLSRAPSIVVQARGVTFHDRQVRHPWNNLGVSFIRLEASGANVSAQSTASDILHLIIETMCHRVRCVLDKYTLHGEIKYTMHGVLCQLALQLFAKHMPHLILQES